jgi:hypothetical protein
MVRFTVWAVRSLSEWMCVLSPPRISRWKIVYAKENFVKICFID